MEEARDVGIGYVTPVRERAQKAGSRLKRVLRSFADYVYFMTTDETLDERAARKKARSAKEAESAKPTELSEPDKNVELNDTARLVLLICAYTLLMGRRKKARDLIGDATLPALPQGNVAFIRDLRTVYEQVFCKGDFDVFAAVDWLDGKEEKEAAPKELPQEEKAAQEEQARKEKAAREKMLLRVKQIAIRGIEISLASQNESTDDANP